MFEGVVSSPKFLDDCQGAAREAALHGKGSWEPRVMAGPAGQGSH